MKTLTITSQKVTDGMLLLILGITLILLMSCKEDSSTDLTYNATSIRSDANSGVISRLDDNSRYPSQLIELHNTAERIFQVTQLVYIKRNIESAPEKMNQTHD